MDMQVTSDVLECHQFRQLLFLCCRDLATILADYGSRYQSKLFNPDFLHAKKLPVPEWLERKSNIEPPFEKS